jgi:ABC-type proline/glycine betaine transport system ATPase subunit
MAHVEIDNVSKAYGPYKIIEGLDLNVADEEFVVLVGPSGCGKTTTLRMIAGLEAVTGGTIRIGNRDVTQLRPGLRNCAMVFQNYAPVIGTVGAFPFTAQMQVGVAAAPDRFFDVTLDLERAHLFDKVSGKTIS